MQTEQDRVRRLMQDIEEGNSVGDKLVYDRGTKTLRPASACKDSDGVIEVRPQDMSVYFSADSETETEQD